MPEGITVFNNKTKIHCCQRSTFGFNHLTVLVDINTKENMELSADCSFLMRIITCLVICGEFLSLKLSMDMIVYMK